MVVVHILFVTYGRPSLPESRHSTHPSLSGFSAFPATKPDQAEVQSSCTFATLSALDSLDSKTPCSASSPHGSLACRKDGGTLVVHILFVTYGRPSPRIAPFDSSLALRSFGVPGDET